MKQIQMLFAFGVLLVVFGSFLTGIHTARAASYSQIAPGIVTGGGATTANVTLVKPPLDNDLVNVTGITSTVSDADEVPAATAYNSTSKVLTISGLKESTSRALTITYEYGRLDSSSDTFMTIFPILMIVGGVGVVIWGIWSSRH